MDAGVCQIDDFGPIPVVRPEAVDQVCALVRRAAAEGQALYPLGGQTMLGVGLPPSRPGLGVDLRLLNRVVDYPARDMTITVQAGITVGELQKLLATENQRLPVDVPRADQATLGGSLAVNVSGPRRYGFGTWRDYVIGITTVNDEGQEVKAGGRVVKNVAGYDLCKLHVGALGTLGIISQVTLKLRPLPETQALVTLGCGPAALEGLLDRLHQTRTRPVCLDVLNASAARIVGQAAGLPLPEAAWVVVVGFEDSEPAVGWQVQQLIREMPPAGVQGLEARAGTAGEPLWQSLVEFLLPPPSQARSASAGTVPALALRACEGAPRLSFKANLLPSAVASFCLHAAALVPEILLHAQAGSGIVRGHLAGDLTLERVQAMLKELHPAAQAAQGNLVLPHCPPEWKHTLPIWGLPRGDAGLMQQVLDKLDRRRLFNPGRFLQG